jgi:hypothetical protein
MREEGIYLVTGTNEPFWPQAERYIKTINAGSNVQNILVSLDFDVNQKEREKYNAVKFVRLNSGQVRSPNPNHCLQHGAFLSVLNFISEEDIIIFTDADIKLQRPFRADEILFFRGIGENGIGVNYNRSDSDFLIEEAGRLKPALSIEEIENKYPEIAALPTYNTGVIIAKYKTYAQLYDLYNKHWAEFKNIFMSNAKQQWLLSYLINKNFKPVIIPDLIHTHGKYPVDLRVQKESEYKYVIDNELVALNHNIEHPAEYQVNRLNKKIRSLQKRIKNLSIILIFMAILLIFFIVINII